jgi:peroxiredoxin
MPTGDELHAPPDSLPAPKDDGAAEHLRGAPIPALLLLASTGERLELAALARRTLILYVYPRTGVPGQPLPTGWDEIPGARGCTPQSCAFRDSAEQLAALGATVFGLSSQAPEEQREFAGREGLPYPLLNDGAFELAAELHLPSFEAAGERYYRRLTLIARGGRIVKVFYPVFPPQQNAAEVLAWLNAHPG